MYLVGITGSIASGKSTILKRLRELGYLTIDADEVVHQILEGDDQLWAKLVARFGDEILGDDGRICRSCLARIVFADAEELAFLESQVHPRVLEAIVHLLNSLLASEYDKELVFIEATLIFRSGFDSMMDEIWLVECPRSEQMRRLVEERNFSEEEAQDRVDAIPRFSSGQLSVCQRVDNSGTFEYTERRIDELLRAALESALQKDTE